MPSMGAGPNESLPLTGYSFNPVGRCIPLHSHTEAGTVRRLCRGVHLRANTPITVFIIRRALEGHWSDARSALMRAATGGVSTVCSLSLISSSSSPCLAFLVFSLHSSSFLLYSRFLLSPCPLLSPLMIVVAAAAAAAV